MTKSEQSKVVQAMLRKLLKDAMTLAELTGRKPKSAFQAVCDGVAELVEDARAAQAMANTEHEWKWQEKHWWSDSSNAADDW